MGRRGLGLCGGGGHWGVGGEVCGAAQAPDEGVADGFGGVQFLAGGSLGE